MFVLEVFGLLFQTGGIFTAMRMNELQLHKMSMYKFYKSVSSLMLRERCFINEKHTKLTYSIRHQDKGIYLGGGL